MPEAGGTGNPSSPSLRPAAFPGPAGNPIPEAPGRGRSVHLPRACVCVWRGPGLAEENKWGAVGGGLLRAGWGELAEGPAGSSTQSVCYAAPGLACIYLC